MVSLSLINKTKQKIINVNLVELGEINAFDIIIVSLMK